VITAWPAALDAKACWVSPVKSVMRAAIKERGLSGIAGRHSSIIAKNHKQRAVFEPLVNTWIFIVLVLTFL
jgi:hypothetical protein